MQDDTYQKQAESVQALFPTPQDRERLDDLLTRQLLNAAARLITSPVTPAIDLASFRCELAGFDFRVPCQIEKLLAWQLREWSKG